MNKISPSIVMVEDISSSLSRATFSEADLEKAAQLILKMEGTITPIILQKNGIDSYTVIDGDFEYYAALKAEEIDPMKGETINAYVIKSKKELPFYQKQIEIFRKSVKTGMQPKDGKKKSSGVDNTEVLNAIRDISIQLHDLDSQQTRQNTEVNTNFKKLEKDLTKAPTQKSDCTDEQMKNKLREIFARATGTGLGGVKGQTLKKIFDNWS